MYAVCKILKCDWKHKILHHLIGQRIPQFKSRGLFCDDRFNRETGVVWLLIDIDDHVFHIMCLPILNYEFISLQLISFLYSIQLKNY